MSLRSFLFIAAFLVAVLPFTASQGAAVSTEELIILPSQPILRGAGTKQQLLVEARSGNMFVGDLTSGATFSSSNAFVATVDGNGVVSAVADGRASITATVSGRTATTVVQIEDAFAPYPISFRNHVLPVMTKAGCNSGACHGAAAGKNGFKLTLRGYDPELDYLTLSRQAVARRINKVEPAMSLMLLKPTLAVSHAGGRRFSAGSLEYNMISRWIASGMPAPSDSDPAVTRLEVLPAGARLRPGDRQRVLVRAHFADGHAEDVTRWAKFSTSDEGVATVDDKGGVKLQAPGEAAISVWYLSRVSAARVSSPFPHAPDVEVYRGAARNNFIDNLVLRKLEELGIGPSGLSSDTEFVRRAYLDAAGILPTAEEVRQFLADKSPDKRGRLIDSLLGRPEFVDYWAYKWSDLLLVSSKKLSGNAMWSYYNWIHSSVAENKSWDRMARELLTASGNTLANGAANYYVLHKDPIDITENISMAFMGFSITCARCHNHPLEKWTQKDYYQMANLFSRVALKNGATRGDTTVYSSSTGEINHPRLNEPLPPRPLSGPELPLNSNADRRQHFANWLTSPDNPFFARSLVNRIWKNFMGRGLVEPVDDIREINPPSNPDLLDALAHDFVNHGFDIKHLIAAIMKSSAYQLTSVPNESNRNDLKYHSHYIARRLPAEVLLDAISQATGVAEKFKGHPEGRRALQLPDTQIDSYFLDAFGRPPRLATVDSERQQEPTITQVLHVINGDTINRKLRASRGLIQKLIDTRADNRTAVESIYLVALSRYPTVDELARISGALEGDFKQELELVASRKSNVESQPSVNDGQNEGSKTGEPDEIGETEDSPPQAITARTKKSSSAAMKANAKFETRTSKPNLEALARRQVLEDLVWAVLTGKEFLFNH
ncbi:MAG TPA: DUF1553 domain-containing protein [Acidobacteriota bacterium]|jgi:hypothetical protein|nr:DUF1553 domain-containing protein [Acidobacteriota bacterium]